MAVGGIEPGEGASRFSGEGASRFSGRRSQDGAAGEGASRFSELPASCGPEKVPAAFRKRLRAAAVRYRATAARGRGDSAKVPAAFRRRSGSARGRRPSGTTPSGAAPGAPLGPCRSKRGDSLGSQPKVPPLWGRPCSPASVRQRGQGETNLTLVSQRWRQPSGVFRSSGFAPRETPALSKGDRRSLGTAELYPQETPTTALQPQGSPSSNPPRRCSSGLGGRKG